MFQIQAQAKQIRAAIYTSAVSDIRYYLNGICLEATEERTITVGCDGKILSVMTFTPDTPNSIITLIVPLDIVKHLTKKHDVVTFTGDDKNNWKMETTDKNCNRISINFNGIEGKYPEWRRVVPSETKIKETEPAMAQFRAENLLAMEKCAKILGGGFIHLEQRGCDAARASMTDYPDFVGVVMPVRAEKGNINPALTGT